MELIPASAEALHELDQSTGHDHTGDVQHLAREIHEIVPSCVGVSITVDNGALTFTLVASSEMALRLDAAQRAVGGPSLEALQRRQEQVVDDVLDEDRWHSFARAAAASHVRSSLALPLTTDDRLTGSLTLYAADPHAFAGANPRLRALAGGPVGALVTNADLEFTSRDHAADAPRALDEGNLVNQAVGILMGVHGIGPEAATARLEEAAATGGLSLADAARAVLRATRRG